MTTEADGWAVVEGTGIDVCTVSPTRRAAIVNWLVVRGTMVFHSTPDAQIEELWNLKRGDVEVVPVVISRVIN